MKSESPIDKDFFDSSEFSELLLSAKKYQIESAKNKMNNLNNPQNPLMKKIFADKKQVQKGNTKKIG